MKRFYILALVLSNAMVLTVVGTHQGPLCASVTVDMVANKATLTGCNLDGTQTDLRNCKCQYFVDGGASFIECDASSYHVQEPYAQPSVTFKCKTKQTTGDYYCDCSH